MADDVTITIDGQEISAQPGQMIIQAAMDAGLYIPLPVLLPGDEAIRRVPNVRSDC